MCFNYPQPALPLTYLRELKESEGCEGDGNVQDCGFDDRYESNVDKDYILEESCEKVLIEVLSLFFEPIDHVIAKLVDLISTSIMTLAWIGPHGPLISCA